VKSAPTARSHLYRLPRLCLKRQPEGEPETFGSIGYPRGEGLAEGVDLRARRTIGHQRRQLLEGSGPRGWCGWQGGRQIACKLVERLRSHREAGCPRGEHAVERLLDLLWCDVAVHSPGHYLIVLPLDDWSRKEHGHVRTGPEERGDFLLGASRESLTGDFKPRSSEQRAHEDQEFDESLYVPVTTFGWSKGRDCNVGGGDKTSIIAGLGAQEAHRLQVQDPDLVARNPGEQVATSAPESRYL
jgi:hypothetical protein